MSDGSAGPGSLSDISGGSAGSYNRHSMEAKIEMLEARDSEREKHLATLLEEKRQAEEEKRQAEEEKRQLDLKLSAQTDALKKAQAAAAKMRLRMEASRKRERRSEATSKKDGLTQVHNYKPILKGTSATTVMSTELIAARNDTEPTRHDGSAPPASKKRKGAGPHEMRNIAHVRLVTTTPGAYTPREKGGVALAPEFLLPKVLTFMMVIAMSIRTLATAGATERAQSAIEMRAEFTPRRGCTRRTKVPQDKPLNMAGKVSPGALSDAIKAGYTAMDRYARERRFHADADALHLAVDCSGFNEHSMQSGLVTMLKVEETDVDGIGQKLFRITSRTVSLNGLACADKMTGRGEEPQTLQKRSGVPVGHLVDDVRPAPPFPVPHVRVWHFRQGRRVHGLWQGQTDGDAARSLPWNRQLHRADLGHTGSTCCSDERRACSVSVRADDPPGCSEGPSSIRGEADAPNLGCQRTRADRRAHSRYTKPGSRGHRRYQQKGHFDGESGGSQAEGKHSNGSSRGVASH